MKFSVLLPTRNGGSQLEDCVRSVLDQDYDDLELVLSDNASDEETREVIASIGDDPRLKRVRLDEPVGVVQSWTRAYAESSGDYVVLVGDDDYVLPGYFEVLGEQLERYRSPDCLTYNGYLYAFPGCLGEGEPSHYADPFAVWDEGLPSQGELPREARLESLRRMFRFDFPIHLSLGTTLVARSAVERLPAGFFKDPFPDFYALGALMISAQRWAYTPEKLIVIGVSPKSFGQTVHHDASKLGYLGTSTDFPGQLPGNEIINGTWLTLRALEEDFPAELAGVEIDRSEYVVQQVYSWYVRWRLGQLSARQLARLFRMLSATDLPKLGRALGRRASPAMVRRNVDMDTGDSVRYLWPRMKPLPDVQDIGDFARWLEQRQAVPS